MKLSILLSIGIFVFISCGKNEGHQYSFDNTSVNNFNYQTKSTTAGNLIADALVIENDADVALYPIEFLGHDHLSVMSTDNLSSLFNSYDSSMPNGSMDQFRLGSMSGKDLKKFITQRVMEKNDVAFQTSGVKYHFHFVGGLSQYSNFTIGDNQDPVEDDRFYRVLISDYFYFSGDTFPSYKYRNGIERMFNDTGVVVSAKQSVKNYLSNSKFKAYLTEVRVLVTKFTKSFLGHQKISSIQGPAHISKIIGHTVKTEGIVTAIGFNDWFPGGYDVYIQSENSDGDSRTSEAIRVYLPNDSYFIEMGDKLEVYASVFEKMTDSGLSETTLMDVSNIKILSKGNELPKPIILGENGIHIPSSYSSQYRGNVNEKSSLDLSEALDFMESLEGMRIKVSNPTIVGFRGGNQDFEDLGAKGNLTLYIKSVKGNSQTHMSGALQSKGAGGHHPDILSVSTGHLTRGIVLDTYYKVGDKLSGDIEGNLIYQKNLFGGGEYSVVLPKAQSAFDVYHPNQAKHIFTQLEDRPRFENKSDENSLTIATYNVENLSASQERRMKEIGKMIRVNLNCPDILNLVEIQDANGESMSGGSSATKTLQNLISNISCEDVKYEAINIDPDTHSDGGVPGGNIQVAMIYNSNKLIFNRYGNAQSLTDAFVNSNGSLSHNPVKLFANDPLFRRTRKSIAAEFEFKSRKILVIANHLNSKLGDTDPMGAMQPFASHSETKRIKLATRLSEFISLYQQKNPSADVFVAGDFNANIEELSMRVLAGEGLVNTLELDKFVPKNMRYTTNHNGVSQPLDYIFVSKNILSRLEDVMPVHINSDYMGRLSDHDPVILKVNY